MFLDKRITELSGGQKRRSSIAIAYLANSKIIIIDEPTAGLDCNSKRNLWKLIRNSKANRIILMTTHYLDEAENLSDKIIILNNGSFVAAGSLDYLRNLRGEKDLSNVEVCFCDNTKIPEFIQ